MKLPEAVDALGALAQADRLRVFRLLVRVGPEGLAAGEIARELDLRGPTLTFHLTQLVDVGLLVRRSEGRKRIYAIRPDGMNDLFAFLADDCCQGRQSLCTPPPKERFRALRAQAARPTVLFLCSRNSARSQMAEALLRHKAGRRFDVYSAGVRPHPIRPMARRALREIGVSTRGLRSTDLGELIGTVGIHHAIVVCDEAQEDCAHIQPFAAHRTFWPIDDPARAPDLGGETIDAYRTARDDLDQRIDNWLAEQEQTS
ncbi:MAG: helix-turn-helix domain-containing protein [Planctomycetota bacterium]|nr:helix-turn-helix domain-containing protein [Planctomycetota bacterium]